MFLFEGLVEESIMAMSELDSVCGEGVLVFGVGLGLLLCIGCQVLVLVGIGMVWGCRCI